MSSISERMKYWLDRVERVLYEGKRELHVTPEEFNDLRQLEEDIEMDKMQREVDMMRMWPELAALGYLPDYVPHPPVEPDSTMFNSYSGAVAVVIDWPTP